MRTQIIQIGNSNGVRIPKVLLADSGITGEVDLELHPDGILIRNAQKPRSGWAEAFKSAEHDDDDLAGTGATSNFEKREWQW